jgi:hypothetical protein
MFKAKGNLVFHLSSPFAAPGMVVITSAKHQLRSVMENAQSRVIAPLESCAKSSSLMIQRVKVPFEFVAVPTAKVVCQLRLKLFWV